MQEVQRTAREKRVAVVKFRENKGTDKSVGCLRGECVANGADLTKLKVSCSTD